MTSWWIIFIYIGIFALIPITIILFSTGISKINNRIKLLKSMGINESGIVSAKGMMKYCFIGYWVLPFLLILLAGLTDYLWLVLIALIIGAALFVLMLIYRAKALKLSWLPESTNAENAETPNINSGEFSAINDIKAASIAQAVNDSSFVAEKYKVGTDNNEKQPVNKSSERNENDSVISESLTDYQFCRKCGKRIPSDSVFCNYCGTKVIK